MLPALHIPDGFIDVPTSALFGLLTVVLLALALKRAKGQLDDRVAPMAGLAAVFIFAMQMLNFPVAAGTSGHLVGAAIGAVLIGPWAAALALTVVLAVQALFFADGGLIAFGLNVFNLAFVAVFVAWGVFLILKKVLPANKTGLLIATGIGAFVSVPASALAFSLQFALGGTEAISASTVTAAMVSVHLLIGIGEAIISVLTVSAVIAARPDLAFGAKHYLKPTLSGSER
ncbi:MAG: energy-coupling factor ABC transporter permease [Candidatus Nanopelagicales bacterium]